MALAMMMPTAVPVAAAVRELTINKANSTQYFAVFVGGYVLVWIGFSIVAAGLQKALAASGVISPAATMEKPIQTNT